MSKSSTVLTAKDRYAGSLLGLAAGDAVGTTVEFSPPGSFAPVVDMVGGGPFGLKAGEWTDDTSMALCIAASLLERKGFDATDQMKRYCQWYRKGYMSSNGVCFDIGNTVRAALHIFEASGRTFAGSSHPRTAGNGSLMRLAPVPLAFASDPAKAIEYSGLSSRTTHGAQVAVDACRYFAALLVGALNGASKDELTSAFYAPVADYWKAYPLCKEIADIAAGSFKQKQPPAIKGSGYAAHSLEAVLWAFDHSQDFKTGCLLAVNLGDDTDTTAAIFGQLAGAYYGVDAIPETWRNKIAKRDLIVSMSEELLKLSQDRADLVLPATTATDFAASVSVLQAKWDGDSTEVVLATEAIDALPTSVALAKNDGGNFALAITFGGDSYTRPAGAEGIHPGECRPEWLKKNSAAAIVFDYCLQAGLRPNIAPQGRGGRFSKSFAIFATW